VRSVLDFYRRSPVVAIVAVVVGLALSVGIVLTARSGSVVGPVLLVVVLGIGFGAVLGAVRARGDE
jgi:hypothetical protein